MKNNYTTSENGIKLVIEFEAEILKVYKDPIGLPTLGVGHLLTAAENKIYKVGQKITRAESRRYLREDLAKFERAVNESVTVPITQNQFDALVSFAFNVGASALKKSSVLRNLNNRKFDAAANALLLWNKAGGKALAGLTRRRKAERVLFLTPDKVSTARSLSAPEPTPTPTEPEAGAPSPEPSSVPPVQEQQAVAQPVVEVQQVKPEIEEVKPVGGIQASVGAAITFVTTTGAGVLTWASGAKWEIVACLAAIGIVFVVARFVYVASKEKRESNEKMEREKRAHELMLFTLKSTADPNLTSVKISPMPIKNSDAEVVAS